MLNGIIFTGPSGSGKTTIIKHIINTFDIQLSISYTTRTPRKGEIDGVDYFFINKNMFLDIINNKINGLELEEYTKFNDTFYGSLKHDSCKIYDLEFEGVKHFINKKGFIFIYIKIDKKIVINRLRKRGMNEIEISKRCAMHDKFDELNKIIKFDLIIDNSYDLNNSIKIVENFFNKIGLFVKISYIFFFLFRRFKRKKPFNYRTLLCKFYLVNACTKGDECCYSHNLNEFPCKAFFIRNNCRRKQCMFSHDPSTLDKLDEEIEEVETKIESPFI
ncbi:guanylate kinase [Vairimorpha apis BRL 01]|uniref:Guanylate kinase n=1 Tax=Vairimorpha apis BRL 01 TaxID=1037528 RepID=T0L6W9_9MICR|nr:guanylate kinase [Vairimorpha apis BRL 01]